MGESVMSLIAWHVTNIKHQTNNKVDFLLGGY